MVVDDFVWLPDIAEKLAAKHRVTEDEAEEVFYSAPHFQFIETGYRPGEDVYAALGRTDAGRYLIVFFIHKPEHTAMVISARDMDRAERRRYERHR